MTLIIRCTRNQLLFPEHTHTHTRSHTLSLTLPVQLILCSIPGSWGKEGSALRQSPQPFVPSLQLRIF